MSDEYSKPFWDGAARGVLVLQRCDRCGTIRHYPRMLCSTCYSFDWSPVDSSGRGTVHSWTVTHHAFAPEVAAAVPYTLVTVDLDEGVRALGRFDSAENPTLDQPVTLRFDTDATGAPMPVFTPSSV